MAATGFGWSVGDIVAAIKIVVYISKAFKTAGGAVSKYEEASGFLHSLKTTLDHLARYAQSGDHSGYEVDIAEQLERISPPWKAFEDFIRKYEVSLGASSQRSKLIRAPRAVQYTLKDLSGEVDRLRLAVAQPLQVINTLLSLAMIHQTRLLPQKLLTTGQCKQLVDAINLAATPSALDSRLSLLQANQEYATSHMQSEFEAQAKSILDLQLALNSQMQHFHNETSKDVQVNQSQQMALPSNETSSSSVQPEGTLSLKDFRLLVEDQHWSVIQLLRVLTEQLETIKQTVHNRPFVLDNSYDAAQRTGRRNTAADVTNTAVMLLATMTASVTTGVIVGKVSAPSGVSTVDIRTRSTDASGAFSARRTADVADVQTREKEIITRPLDKEVEDCRELSEKSGHYGQDSSPIEHAKPRINTHSSIPYPAKDEDSGLTRAPGFSERSPRDSVIDSEGPSVTADHFQNIKTVQRNDSNWFENRRYLEGPSDIPQHAIQATTRSWNNSCNHSTTDRVALQQIASRSFFVPGRCFMTLWTAARKNTLLTKSGKAEIAFVDAPTDQHLASAEMRRFLVIRNEGPYSLCVPVYFRGVPGKGLHIQRAPYEIPISMVNDEGSESTSIEDLGFQIDPTNVACLPTNCFVKLDEVYMLDHSVEAEDIGLVTPNDLPLLQSLWRDANARPSHEWLTN